MELRDYLMPGEYILGSIRNIDIDTGRFSNLTITNKRFIAFNVKKKRSLFKTWEEVTDLKSVFFGDSCGVLLRYDKDIKKWLHIVTCEKLVYYPKDKQYLCLSEKSRVDIEPKLMDPPLNDIHRILAGILSSISKDFSIFEDSYSIFQIFVLKEDKCIETEKDKTHPYSRFRE